RTFDFAWLHCIRCGIRGDNKTVDTVTCRDQYESTFPIQKAKPFSAELYLHGQVHAPLTGAEHCAFHMVGRITRSCSSVVSESTDSSDRALRPGRQRRRARPVPARGHV